MRDDRERLADILEAIDRIERHAQRGRAEFDRDEMLQTWIVHHLLIIGEACSAMTRGLTNAHPEVPWRRVAGMRNVLVHNYFLVDHAIVWSVVENDLSTIKEQVREMLDELDSAASPKP